MNTIASGNSSLTRGARVVDDDGPGEARVASSVARWEHYEHSADIGVRGMGATKAEAFEQAALALTAVTTDPRTVEARERVAVECEAPDEELLFIEWLNALEVKGATYTTLRVCCEHGLCQAL